MTDRQAFQSVTELGAAPHCLLESFSPSFKHCNVLALEMSGLLAWMRTLVKHFQDVLG